jgi:hypothetical protein
MPLPINRSFLFKHPLAVADKSHKQWLVEHRQRIGKFCVWSEPEPKCYSIDSTKHFDLFVPMLATDVAVQLTTSAQVGLLVRQLFRIRSEQTLNQIHQHYLRYKLHRQAGSLILGWVEALSAPSVPMSGPVKFFRALLRSLQLALCSKFRVRTKIRSDRSCYVDRTGLRGQRSLWRQRTSGCIFFISLEAGEHRFMTERRPAQFRLASFTRYRRPHLPSEIRPFPDMACARCTFNDLNSVDGLPPIDFYAMCGVV